MVGGVPVNVVLSRLLQEHWLEFALSLLASLLAGWIYARLSRSWRSEFDRLREYLASKKAPDNQQIPRDPKAQIRYVFHRLRRVDRRLSQLCFRPHEVSTGDLLVAGAMYSFLGLNVTAAVGGLPVWSATLAFLILSAMFAGLSWLLRPDFGKWFLVGFPVSWLILPVVLHRKHDASETRAQVVERARWHLLLAMPSSNSALRTIQRKMEHLHHLEKAIEHVSQLRDDPKIGIPIVGVVDQMQRVAVIVREWPSTCSVYLSLDLRQLQQVTITEKAQEGS